MELSDPLSNPSQRVARKRPSRSIEARLARIDEKIEKLTAQRFALSGRPRKNLKPRYFRGTPDKPGVYHYTCETHEFTGGALGRWTGAAWEKYENWGDFTSRGKVIWYGEGKTRRLPLSEETIATLSR